MLNFAPCSSFANSPIDSHKLQLMKTKNKSFWLLLTPELLPMTTYHDTSLTMATSSFHGTSISLIQHPNVKGEGVENVSIKLRNVSTAKTIAPLPSSYTNIPPLSSNKGGLEVLSTQSNLKSDDEAVFSATIKENEWLDHTGKHVEEQTERNKEDMSSTGVKPSVNGKAVKETD